MLQGTKTPAVPSETWELGHLTPSREGIWQRTGIPALLSKVRSSSSAEHCSKGHQWDPVAKVGWKIPVGRDKHTDASSHSKAPWGSGWLLAPWSKTGAPKCLAQRCCMAADADPGKKRWLRSLATSSTAQPQWELPSPHTAFTDRQN